MSHSVPQKVPVSSIPPKFRSFFDFSSFNNVQSACFDLVFNSSENLVISAPTGSGKTVIAELAFLHELQKRDERQSSVKNSSLFVYVAPLRSLCQEKVVEWQAKFEKVGVTVMELTGDSQNYFPKDLLNTMIICTTPEKLDLITRTMQRKISIIEKISIVVFDEIHNLAESRGAVLESTISRMLFISDRNEAARNLNKIRIIGLSATISNYKDFCQWLRVSKETKFDDNYRETKIETRVFGYSTSTSKSARVNDWMFESSLTAKVTPIIKQLSNNKPVLIFCCTRKSCEKTALKLANDFQLSYQQQQMNQQKLLFDNNHNNNNQQPANSLLQQTAVIRDKTLLLTLQNGVGIHTAGLCQTDRMAVEAMFKRNEIRFLCTTSTLSQGINLPAYLVIIKGTKHFIDGSLEEYESTQILQMQGRAGRPQFEKEGVCVIMTEKENVKRYEDIIQNSKPIESSLLDNLIEHLNAEIALGFIHDQTDVIRWLMSTFLYIRINKNPLFYKVKNLVKVDDFLQNLSFIHLKELATHEFIKIFNVDENNKNIESNSGIEINYVGSICSQYGIMINTMKTFNESRTPQTMKETLDMLCKAVEFRNDIIVRQEEKQKLRMMNVQPFLRFEGRSESLFVNKNENFFTSETKVYILIDTILSQGKIEDWSLSQEFTRIKRTAERLLAAMIQLMTDKKKSFLASVNATILMKCLKRQMWENDIMRLPQQIKGIGEVYAKKISAPTTTGANDNGIRSIADLRKMSPYLIEKKTGHRAGWGTPIVAEIRKIPEYSFSFTVSTEQSVEQTVFENKQSDENGQNYCQNLLNREMDVEVTMTVFNMNQEDPLNQYQKVDIFVGIKDEDLLIAHFRVKNIVGHLNKSFTFKVPNGKRIEEITAYLVDSEFIGIDVEQKITVSDQSIETMHNSIVQQELMKKKRLKMKRITEFFQQSSKSSQQKRILATCPELIGLEEEEEVEIVWSQQEIAESCPLSHNADAITLKVPQIQQIQPSQNEPKKSLIKSEKSGNNFSFVHSMPNEMIHEGVKNTVISQSPYFKKKNTNELMHNNTQNQKKEIIDRNDDKKNDCESEITVWSMDDQCCDASNNKDSDHSDINENFKLDTDFWDQIEFEDSN